MSLRDLLFQFPRMNSVYPILEKWGSGISLCKSWVQQTWALGTDRMGDDL